MNIVFKIYLIVCLALTISTIICMDQILIGGPSNNFKITIFTNNSGEGIVEMILAILSIPGQLYMFYMIMKQLMKD